MNVRVSDSFVSVEIVEGGKRTVLSIYIIDSGQRIEIDIPGSPGFGLLRIRDCLAAAVKAMQIVNLGVDK